MESRRLETRLGPWLKAWTSPVWRCTATALPGSSRISSDQPSAAKRSGRNDLPGPVGIHGMPSVSMGSRLRDDRSPIGSLHQARRHSQGNGPGFIPGGRTLA